MNYGCARVSTIDQNLDLQLNALKAVGCDVIEQERISGAKTARPVLDALLARLHSGDVLTVWRLYRLGRSLPHLNDVVESLRAKGVSFASLGESIDTKSAGGRLVFHFMSALAEFERSLIIERTTAGLAAAKRRGTRLGRRPALLPAQVAHARQLIAGGESPGDVARRLDVSRSTLYKHLGS
jgi:DNA invertase Pin-like site-specific DNA recombinase